MALTVNKDLWREARAAGLRNGRGLSGLIGTPQTVLSLFSLTRSLRNVSRLWIERHGERAAGVVSAILNRYVKLEDLFPNWDQPEERPLARRESEQLRRAVEARSEALTAREIRVLWLTFGLEGQPLSLAQVATKMGLTRERVRQIEAAALEKLGIRLPPARHKSTVARRLRARLLLKTLDGELRIQQLRIGPLRQRRGAADSEAKHRASASEVLAS
jgi:RNA polymerase sigma factor (sigma-70 family)